MNLVFLEMRSETSTKVKTSKVIPKVLIQAQKNRGRDIQTAGMSNRLQIMYKAG